MDSATTASDELELLPLAEAMLGAATEVAIEVSSSDALDENLQSIPDRMAFKIGTAAELIGVKPYVLRFWETEFEALRPKKSRKGQRAYSRRDVETAMIIKKLLYEDRFSIEGARARLRELRTKVKEDRVATNQIVHKLADQMNDLKSVALDELRSMQLDLTKFRALLV